MQDANCGQLAKRQSETDEQLGRILSGIDRIDAIQGDYENKLERVVRNESPQTQCEEKPTEVLVPLAETLRLYGDRIFVIADRFESLLNRIEL